MRRVLSTVLHVRMRVSYCSQVLNDLHVNLILFNFLPEPNGLLNFSWVDVFGPATLCVIHTSDLSLKPFSVHLWRGGHPFAGI